MSDVLLPDTSERVFRDRPAELADRDLSRLYPPTDHYNRLFVYLFYTYQISNELIIIVLLMIMIIIIAIIVGKYFKRECFCAEYDIMVCTETSDLILFVSKLNL